MVDLSSKAGAIIVGGYRYLLWRNWVPNNQRRLLWVMLNPSTANATDDDPTLRSCRQMSEHQGFDGLEVVNLFAYRTPYPYLLRSASDDLVGADNDRSLVEAAARADKIVVAWGWRGFYRNRSIEVLELLAPRELFCLGTTQNGSPRHPLYLAQTAGLISYR